MSDAPICTTGKWVTVDGQVVDKEPVEGRLLVAPGGPISPDVKAAIEAAELAAPTTAASVEEDAPAEPAREEKASADPKRGR